MEHKAFVFKYREFEEELLPLLQAALAAHEPRLLREFIEAERSSFSDPYEGEGLGDDWPEFIETPDVHQYGDFALTKYYKPADDIGLGRAWEDIQELLQTKLGASDAVLGRALVGGEETFDPGKMGSYFQTADDVRHHLRQVERIGDSRLEPLAAILRKAYCEQAGLYVTF